VITVENLSKSARSTDAALDDVSVDVPAGSVTVVLGESGSGRTTFARCLAFREHPDSGTVRWDGTAIGGPESRSLRAARREVGFAADTEPLHPSRTVAGNIAAPLETANMGAAQRRSRVGELLDLAGLTDAAALTPAELTAGQRQRALLARALVGKPSLLVADDPTAGLDAAMADNVLTVLDRARSELGATVVVATDDEGAARRIADEVVVFDRGRVVEQGRALDLITEPGSQLAASLLPSLGGERGPGRHDAVAEVVLVGFAAVGALLPETANRFGVGLQVLGGGFTRLGETPVARFRIGLDGQGSEAALKWMTEQDAHVRRAPVSVDGRVGSAAA
jgi:D-methionine transport system ATP-binding protein